MIKKAFTMGTFYNADCFDAMREIPSGSIDMVLCDLPYGTTQNKWDSVIPFEPLWAEYWRVCKPNAAIVLTAAQPFTSALVMSQINMFKHEWIYEKSRGSNPALARYQPLRSHENVLVFGRSQTLYNPQMEDGENYKTRKNDTAVFGGRVAGNKDQNREIETRNNRYPRTVQKFKSGRQQDSVHPTQKPVALFEYLIRTYTNPGDLVLDNTAGSGTTAVAAEACGRRWICMEKDPAYFEKAVTRLSPNFAGAFA